MCWEDHVKSAGETDLDNDDDHYHVVIKFKNALERAKRRLSKIKKVQRVPAEKVIFQPPRTTVCLSDWLKLLEDTNESMTMIMVIKRTSTTIAAATAAVAKKEAWSIGQVSECSILQQ